MCLVLYDIQCKVSVCVFFKKSPVCWMYVARQHEQTPWDTRAHCRRQRCLINHAVHCKHTHIPFSVWFRVCVCTHSSRMLVLAWWQSRITLTPGVSTHIWPLGGWLKMARLNQGEGIWSLVLGFHMELMVQDDEVWTWHLRATVWESIFNLSKISWLDNEMQLWKAISCMLFSSIMWMETLRYLMN